MEELKIADIVDFTTGVGVREYIAKRNGSLALETEPNYKLGEGGMLTSIVPTFGDVSVLHQPYSTRLLQESSTVTDPDLASMGLDLCASCNAKVAAFLEAQRKRIKGSQSPFDSTGELSKNSAVSGMIQEDDRMTSAGMLTPEMAENPFVDDAPSLTLGGLRRPDAMPDENIQQLRELILSRPAPRQSSKHLSLEQLRALGWAQDHEPVLVPDHMIAKGGLRIPDF
jgi:hypothetical protein